MQNTSELMVLKQVAHKQNIPLMQVDKLVRHLSQAYVAILKGDGSLDRMPSVMLWGAPGVGKSQAVRQIASEIEKSTGKEVFVTDVRLLLFNPIDLRGIPTADKTKSLAVWLKPKIFNMNPSNDVVNILFLDEISAAPPTVQAAAYQITLDRTVGEHSLPENCIVIAAGNRLTDKSVAYKMPRALANRLLHISVTVNHSSWKKWAKKKNINPLVIGFLDDSKGSLMDSSDDADKLAFATPRTWEMVSNLLNHVNPDVDESFPLIAGLIGSELASEFKHWVHGKKVEAELKEYCKGKIAELSPDEADSKGKRQDDIERFKQQLLLPVEALRRGLVKVDKKYEWELPKKKKTRINWKDELQAFVQEEINDYSFNPPDRRFGDLPFILPDYNEKDFIVKKVLFMVDTSDSMKDKMVSDCFNEVRSAIDQYNGRLEGWLGFFNTSVVPPQQFNNIDELEQIKPRGSGGTSFAPIFQYVRQNMKDDLPLCIVILTDGHARFPRKNMAMGIPVLWVICDSDVTPPWGKTVRIENRRRGREDFNRRRS